MERVDIFVLLTSFLRDDSNARLSLTHVREGGKGAGLTCASSMNSQTMLNSLPSTKVGNAMRSRPNTRRGRVITLPRNDLGVISPYPTVVIAAPDLRHGTRAGMLNRTH